MRLDKDIIETIVRNRFGNVSQIRFEDVNNWNTISVSFLDVDNMGTLWCIELKDYMKFRRKYLIGKYLENNE